MQELLEQKAQKLAQEYEAGQRMLSDLEAKRQQLQQTLLRIEGAMQVLRELAAQLSEGSG